MREPSPRRNKPPMDEQVSVQVRAALIRYYRAGYWPQSGEDIPGPLTHERLSALVRSDAVSRSLPFITFYFRGDYMIRDPVTGIDGHYPRSASVKFIARRRTQSLMSKLLFVGETSRTEYSLGGRVAIHARGDHAQALVDLLEDSEQVAMVKAAGTKLYPELTSPGN